MTVWEAIPLMASGHKIRCINWNKDDFMYVENGQLKRPLHKDQFVLDNTYDQGGEWEIYTGTKIKVAKYAYKVKSHSTVNVTNDAYRDSVDFLIHIGDIFEFRRLFENEILEVNYKFGE